MSPALLEAPADREALLREYRSVRRTTEALCEPLEREDMVVQTTPDVSPTKWHLAHTTWFFEALVLERSGAPHEVFDDRYAALFNSYYRSLGDPYPRAERGLLSRPTVDEILAYRRHVDGAVEALLSGGPDEAARNTGAAPRRRRSRGTRSTEARSRSASRARGSPTTTNGRGTPCGSSRSNSPRAP